MITQVSIQSLALSRGGRQLFSRLILNFDRGEAVALTGRNGAGKTSLLRAVAGLIAPDSGDIGFGGLDPAEAREHMHLLGHLDGLKSGRTARDELSFWTRFAGGTEDAAAAAAERLELARLLDLEVRRLSAGQKRRLALARLLAAPRPLWLLDEPLSPLDAEWRARFGEIMGEHLAGGGLILAAVHDPLPIPARGVEIGR
ncbi:MAG: heme ABC exporter ATP-binding protein CcmA [Pseudomonadota bacterium]